MQANETVMLLAALAEVEGDRDVSIDLFLKMGAGKRRENWLSLWAFLTTFAVFEFVKHGFVNGSGIEAAVLTTAAVGFIVAPP